MNNNNQRPRIDSSTPKSFYCSPKSYHYIPFAKRRSQSLNFKRQTNDKSCQNRRWNEVSEQNRSCLFTKYDTSNKDSSASSSSCKATFANTNQPDRSIVTQSKSSRLRLWNQQRCKKVIRSSSASKIPPQAASCIYGKNIEEMKEKLDQFKNDVLDDIIQCGVYTDSVIQECISRNMIENSTVTMANLQQAISELLRDIGVFNIEVNKKTQIADSESRSEEGPNYEDEKFESDESESLSVIASVESGSHKLARQDKSPVSNFGSVSIETTNSLTTLSNSSVIDTSN
ncbi:unnamed protein product [Cercopithifilaria johnstoni]|uniref:Uncharacterized protein n=1 Tax=Cercopithifilaria johnstoni TaxID=2874296 RepID=A0A8J2LZ92_9BILA|nr:unnamed protein product [Cercopithifilaria johnstoni]